MNIVNDVKEKLHKINWDFTDSSTRKGIHSIHPYPAKFIPEIPKTLLDILPLPKGTAVLDPFCGSGTTLVEAQSKGFPAVGIDLNPIACLMSKVKTSTLPSNFIGIAKDCAGSAKENDHDIKNDIPNVNHWFKKDIQHAISALVLQINKVEDEVIRDGLRIALSSIIVRVSEKGVRPQFL